MNSLSSVNKLDFAPKAVIFDFDGVITDNFVYSDSNGNESVRSSKSDSLAISLFRKEFPEISLVVISSELNPVVTMRCNKLGLDSIHGSTDKVKDASKWLENKHLSFQDVIFVCNDKNDVDLADAVGYAVAVADSHESLLRHCQFQSTHKGGQGAVREILERISVLLKSKDKFALVSNVRFIDSYKDLGPREWGQELLIGSASGKYTFKRLELRKGCKGGLQYHQKKHEMGFLLSGSLLIRFSLDGKTLREKVVSEGCCFEFPPFAVHQEEALEDCVILEVSTPFLNDRVRVENQFGLDQSGGLPSTSLSEIVQI